VPADVFQHGVASGDPLTDRVMIWTRVTPDDAGLVDAERTAAGAERSGSGRGIPGRSGATHVGVSPPAESDAMLEVHWVVARDAAITDVVATGVTTASAEHDWTVHVDVGGLEPASTSWYGFRALDTDSPIARTRTLPTQTGHCRFAMVSCAKFNAGFFNVYPRIAARDDLDFLLHLGDYIYEASNTPPASQTPGADIGRPFDPLGECVTLDDYRTRYNQYHRDPDVQALHARHPIIPTLDDHEFADGAWRDGSTEHKEEYGPWANRRREAFQAREEWLPVRRPDPDDPERVWRRVALGALVDIFLIDTRTRRDEPVAEPALSDPGRSAMGPEQRDWLFGELTASTATWRLLANPSVLASTWSATLNDVAKPALAKVKLIDPVTFLPDFDQWDGYPAERTALLELISGFDNLVVLSGDVHISLATELHRDPFDPDDPPVAVEFVTPSITSQNLDDKMGWPRHSDQARAAEQACLDGLPHWKWVDLDSHGYVIVDVSPNRLTAEYWHLDTVLERSPGEARAAVFAVDRGTPRALRVE